MEVGSREVKFDNISQKHPQEKMLYPMRNFWYVHQDICSFSHHFFGKCRQQYMCAMYCAELSKSNSQTEGFLYLYQVIASQGR